MAKSWCVFEKTLFFFFCFYLKHSEHLCLITWLTWLMAADKDRRAETWHVDRAWCMLTFLIFCQQEHVKNAPGKHKQVSQWEPQWAKDSSRLPLVLRKERRDNTVRRSCTQKVSSECPDRRRFSRNADRQTRTLPPALIFTGPKKKRPLAAAQVRRWCRVQGNNW